LSFIAENGLISPVSMSDGEHDQGISMGDLNKLLFDEL
jgi:hypothetical protein